MLKLHGHPDRSAYRPARALAVIAIIAVVTVTALVYRSATLVRPVEAVSTSIVISQVYGGGGNGGSTYKNDFIELLNVSSSPVDVSGWSVQYASATGAFAAASGTSSLQTNLCASATPGTCVIQPGHYFLVQEAQGTGGTTNLPTPDASGTIAMSATNGKVLLNSSTTAITGTCPTGGTLVDLLGYGTANCAEGTATAALTNTTADLRNGAGCTDTDNNSADFTIGAPNPRNSASPITNCANPTPSPSPSPSASPSPNACPASSPVPNSCGVERWSVKTGTDADASLVNINSATPVSIATMRSWNGGVPPSNPPANNRIAPYETTQWVISGTMTVYKLESDSDYHVVVQDGSGNTLVTEIPYPGASPPCVSATSPFAAGIAKARCKFDTKFASALASGSFQTANVPVRVTGVGMFDFAHGQTGAAPNQIELHPITDIDFPTTTSTPTQAGANVVIQSGDAKITFPQVDTPGTTTVAPIDPSTAGTAPAGYSLTGPGYDISTTASYTASAGSPINICFNVPSVTDQDSFNKLKVLHSEGGSLVDRTSGQDFSQKLVCARTPSLSPFVVALGPSPTAAPGFITGRVLTSEGEPLDGVTVNLSGEKSARAITDSNGLYSFADVEVGALYTVTASRANYNLSPASRTFSLLGIRAEAGFTAEAAQPSANPLDTDEFFVRQQYLDFLGREPEQGGLDYWSAQLAACKGDEGCIRQKRIGVSAAFFISDEFQETGFFVYRMHQAAFGTRPNYQEFTLDRSHVGAGPIIEINKTVFVNEFIAREEFKRMYPETLTPEQFVNKLFDNAGLVFSPLERQYYINAMQSGTGRADVLRGLVETESFKQKEYNRAFVLMQYYGYLRRDVDEGGYQFWLDVLNRKVPNNYRAMVCAFVTSAEYQDRFSPVHTHTNGECAP